MHVVGVTSARIGFNAVTREAVSLTITTRSIKHLFIPHDSNRSRPCGVCYSSRGSSSAAVGASPLSGPLLWREIAAMLQLRVECRGRRRVFLVGEDVCVKKDVSSCLDLCAPLPSVWETLDRVCDAWQTVVSACLFSTLGA